METSIVLLPGLDGTGLLFRPLLEHLPPALAPLVVSYPGREKLGYRALLPRILQSLPTDRPFLVLGESFSGPLAVLAAAARPAGLRGVILCATFVRNPLWFRATWLRHLIPDSVFRRPPREFLTRRLMGRHGTPALRELLRSAVAEVAPAVLAFRVREVMQVNASAELEACPFPILCLRGSEDRVVPAHNARAIARLSARVSGVTIAAPHMLLQAEPEEATSAILRWVETAVASKPVGIAGARALRCPPGPA